MSSATSFVQIILLISAIFISLKTYDRAGLALFTIHPTLHSISILVFVANALLSTSEKNFITRNFSYQQRITFHWVLQVSALVCMVTAQIAIYVTKERLKFPHFESWHSKLGLASMITMFAGMFGGNAAKFSHLLRNIFNPIKVKAGHTILGASAYILFIFTLSSGFRMSWNEMGDESLKNIMSLILLITTIFIVKRNYSVGFAKFKKTPVKKPKVK